MGVATASAQKLRLMSYNIHHCSGIDGVHSVDRIAEVFKKFSPDVVAIQEVDSLTRRSKADQVGVLAEKAGYHGYFMQTIPHTGGGYGIGVLSKEKALSVKRVPLPCRREPRGFLLVEFKGYYFACTHFSLVEEDRVASVEIIRNLAKTLDKPLFVAGDLNAKPESKTMVAFKEFMTILNNTNQYTFNAASPSVCIDYVMGCGVEAKVEKSYIDYDNHASDHLPLFVDIALPKQKKKKK